MDARIVMGHPVNLGEICKVYPPSLNDVLSYREYHLYVDLLTSSQEDIWDEMAESEGDIPKEYPTPFNQLMHLAAQSEDNSRVIGEAIEFFVKESVTVRSEGGLVLFTDDLDEVQDLSQLRFLSDKNFFAFQNLIRLAIGQKALEAPRSQEHPRVAMIKARARRRDRIKAKQNTKKGGIGLGEMLVALSCMNVGFFPLREYGEMSYATAMELFRVGQGKMKYETDMMLIAGKADPKKVKPKSWVGLEE